MRACKNTILLAILLELLLGFASAQTRKVYPVDEGPKDASFLSFRKELMEAIKRHDQKFVLSILDANILNSYGGNGGIEEFKETWQMDKSDSELWETLREILSLGGVFIPDPPEEGGGMVFCAPYLCGRFPEDIDALDHLVVTARKVNVRARPSLNAPAVATLSFDVVRYADPMNDTVKHGDGHTWNKIVTLDGKIGYVSGQFLRSPMEHYACFKKIDGKWRMTSLVGGD